ncbi:MAG: 2-hydroxyglutaryl-CoA dehydratase [Tindallia sp. MSAO_Bac2]|nr:MAG: 2-hydroxyglutaryl-CoA dehydratase [Tindallia sp. MSAO_Bac2]
MQELFMGVDVGSVSTNIVVIDKDINVVSSQYIRTNGQPLETVKKGLKQLKSEFPDDTRIHGVGTTGSGRQLVGVMIGADVIKNEITAHATATIQFVPDVRTIFEIGGQDSKIIVVEDQMVVDFAMNTVCAAGTGSFLDHQAERLGIPIDQFGGKALSADRDVRIAGRCTVFAESDMIAKQQFGFSKAEIIKGLCEALVRNYINNLGRGKKLEPPYVFQGGVAANEGIKAAFEKEINHEVLIPEHFNIMGAVGAAILARDEIFVTGRKSKFRGLSAADLEFTPRTFECEDCPNHCEVIEVKVNDEVVARWGDRCGKWTNSVQQLDL